MYTSINSNTLATQINGVYNRNQSYMNAALTKAATGQRINSAKDSPADWSISERMRERINSLNQVNQNVQNDSAFIKTASAGIQNDIDILKTLKERALNAANASTSDDDRAVLQAEVKQLIAQIDTNANSTKFNGKTLLTGKIGSPSSDAPATSNATYYGAVKAGEDPSDNSEVTVTADSVLNNISWLSLNQKDGEVTWKDASGDSKSAKIADVLTDPNDPDSGDSISKTNTVQDYIDKLNASLAQAGAGFQLTFVANENAALATTLYGVAITGKTDVDGTNEDTTDTVAAANSLTFPGIKAVATAATEKDDAVFTDVALTLNSVSIATLSNTRMDQLTIKEAPKSIDEVQDSGQDWFQVGADSGMQITFNIASMQSTSFGEAGVNLSKIDLTTDDKADASISLIDQALTTALSEATKLGALEQRLGYTADNVATQIENMEASDSAIRDADMAKEMTNYMKYMVLSQASQYMLAQANQNGFSVLNLFQQ